MEIRYLKDMLNVLADKNFVKSANNLELYYMNRGVEEKNGLRYDVTIVPAVMLGKEFNKTKGHYHFQNWQEIYTVLEGQAIYLMQKRNVSGEISDVYAVKTEKGESIIIPPGYGHVTINPSETNALKMSNWISPDCKSDYSDFEKFGGACYYYILENGEAKWIKNKNYKSTPELRFEEPLKSLPENLDFLKHG